ncbi:HIRA-interacting protein 3 [Rhynchocyon petersi]
MARDSEMQEFTRKLFRGRPDLSTLTHSIVRQKFLAHVGRDHLKPEEKQALKRLVEEELLKMQVEEKGTEKQDFMKKVKRSVTPTSDSERKRFRFNSESASRMAEAKVSPAKERPKRTSKKLVTGSNKEEQQGVLSAKARPEEVVKEISEEEEESSEEEEEMEFKGRTKTTVTKSKQTGGKASARRKQAVESEDSEEDAARMMQSKRERKRKARSDQQNERESEDEDTSAKKKEDGEDKKDDGYEEEERRIKSHGRKRLARDERRLKRKSRTGRLIGDSGDREKEEDSGDGTEAEGKLPGQRTDKDRTSKAGKRQSRSSEEGGEAARGRGEATAKGSSISGDSDVEREVSNSEAEETPKVRKNSSKKSSKKGKTRSSSSSSSSDGSPERKGRKAVSDRGGKDHPAVMRLKRYIRACGAYRNYKKLLGSCHSHKERLRVLRAELEALGMKGNPSMEKCRALKEQREEAAEVASLDISNIISSSGRPRRRTAWNPSRAAASPGEPYRRTLDSDEERPRPPPLDWSHMRGIISSDGESN